MEFPAPSESEERTPAPPLRHTLTLEEAAQIFAEAGLPRNIRSLQRYCAAGRLECIKEETASGLAYFVEPASVERAIKQLAQLHALTDEARHVAPDRTSSHLVIQHDMRPSEPASERNVAASRAGTRQHSGDFIQETEHDQPRHEAPTSRDEPRPVAPGPDMTQKYVERLEGEIAFLRGEISTKNLQITDLSERSRETNVLIGGLQRMLSPLLGSPDPHPPRTDGSPM